jgi:energy-coupling factor transporter ATP-binding protein EcfA2
VPPRPHDARCSRAWQPAARAELTLFDEPYAGLNAVASQLFYDRLLADFAEDLRTVVLSTHLIDEVADLLERVVLLDHGRVVLDAPADAVRGTALTVSGPAAAVEEFVAGAPGLAPAAARHPAIECHRLATPATPKRHRLATGSAE